MAIDSSALERSLELEKRFGHRLKLIWGPKSALATYSNCSGTKKAMAIDSIALERSLEPEKRFGHRLKFLWNLKSALATNSIALERSLQPENRFGHRLKLLSSGLWNSKSALAGERNRSRKVFEKIEGHDLKTVALSCAFV